MGKSRYVIKQSTDGGWYYVLVAGNGEVLSASEIYTREEDALRAAAEAQDVSIEANITDEG